MEPGDIAAFDNGRCWICDKEPPAGRRLAVDHDHETRAVRGFLCTSCNVALGHFRDDPALLRRAADYLERARFDFADACEQCTRDPANTFDDVVVMPGVVVESESRWTVFGYQCPQGHVWTCGFKTRGVPFMWRL